MLLFCFFKSRSAGLSTILRLDSWSTGLSSSGSVSVSLRPLPENGFHSPLDPARCELDVIIFERWLALQGQSGAEFELTFKYKFPNYNVNIPMLMQQPKNVFVIWMQNTFCVHR